MKKQKEAVNPGWGAWVVGFFTAIACRPSRLARFTPGAGRRAWPFGLTRFHSPSLPITHLNE